MAQGGEQPLDGGPDPSLCAWCESPVASDGHCPECGRRQTRICSCGRELHAGEDPCPGCGAEWTGLVKVVRRKKRRHAVNPVELLGYTALGVFVALLAAALVNALIGGLALKSAEDAELPESLTERMALAWHSAAESVGGLLAATMDRLGGVTPFVLVGLLGGLLGILHYLRRTGGLGRRRNAANNGPDPRRRRRI